VLMQSHQRQIHTLQATNGQLAEQLTRTQQLLVNQPDRESLGSRVSNVEVDKLVSLTTKLQEAETERVRIQMELVHRGSEIDTMRGEYEAKKRKMEDEIFALRRSIDENRQRNENSASERQGLRDEYRQLEVQYQQALMEKEVEMDGMRLKIEYLSRGSLPTATPAGSANREQQHSWNELLKKLEMEQISHNQDVIELKSSILSLETEVQQMGKKHSVLQVENKDLKSKLGSLQTKCDNLAAEKSRLLSARDEDMTRKTAELQQLQKASAEEIRTLQEEATALRSRLRRLEGESMKGATDAQRAVTNGLQQQLQSAEADLEGMRTMQKSLQMRIHMLESKGDALTVSNKQLQKQLQSEREAHKGE